jgi:hypothetical protein
MIVINFTLTSLLFALLVVLPVSAQINFIQQNYTTSNPASSSLPVAYPAAQTAGNLNIVVVGWNDTSAAVSSVADSRGNSYTLAVGPTAGTALMQSIYYAKNIAAGSNTVTVTFNRTAVYPDVRVLEYTGADTTNPLDVTMAAAGAGLTANSGLAATTSLNELIFGAGTTFEVFRAAGSGFTDRVITNFGDIAEDATVLSMGSYSATAPLGKSTPWVMQMATFRGQGSDHPVPTVTSITPNSGTTGGGTAATITGTNFASGATVSLGGTAATGVNVVSSTSITATTPANAAGAVNVVVTNADSESGILTSGYTYTSTSGGGGGTISFVQVNAATPQTPSTSVAVSYPSAQTAGNLNIVAVGWDDATSAVSSVMDSNGNPYLLAAGPITGTGGRESIYYAKNIAAGSNTVTVTFSNAAVYADVRVLEYSGLDTLNPLDQPAAAAGTGTSANSGSATTTTAKELIFGAGKTSGRFTAAGNGFISRIITSPDGDIAEDKIVSLTGSYSATAPVTPSSWVMQMAAFRASGQSSSKHSVSLSWDAPPTSTTVAFYNVYRGTVSGGPYNLLSTGVTSTDYTDPGVQSGATYYYVTTTVDAARLESDFSNELQAVIPAP